MAALRRMRPRDRGTIVQVGSALAYRGIPLQSAYCGAKHAIEGFTESLRTELLHEGSRRRADDGADAGPEHAPVRHRAHAPAAAPAAGGARLPAGGCGQGDCVGPEHPRREIKVGASTAITVIGNKVLPGVGDRYLARTGFEAQQTDQPVNGDRPDNLFAPLPGDRGAHGDFDDESKHSSVQLWLTTHKGTLAAAGAGAVGTAAALLVARTHR